MHHVDRSDATGGVTSTGGADPEGPKQPDDDEPDRVQLDRVESRLGSADEGLQVRAHSASEERRHKGTTLSASGGGLAFVGGFLAVFGGSAERVGLAVGGAVTAGIGLALLAGGLSMIRGACPRAEVLPRRVARGSRAAVTLTPTGVAGRF